MAHVDTIGGWARPKGRCPPNYHREHSLCAYNSPPGTVSVNGRSVPMPQGHCPPGQYVNPKTGHCRKFPSQYVAPIKKKRTTTKGKKKRTTKGRKRQTSKGKKRTTTKGRKRQTSKGKKRTTRRRR